MDFSKAENKICRTIFELALQREFQQGLNRFAEILDKWKTDKPDDMRESYYSIFNAVTDFDKHIARRYDGLRNSFFYNTIIGLLIDEIITANDLAAFSQDRQSELLSCAERMKDFC
ncbi:hypothetical protein DU508_05940 [Pedobacter chinensis]|uniref:Uncharacterized protein n=1 Tax=Pedobacter chinensis TaxID=2282421 RepID=A0A369PVQ1_9SPHI|nr:hypothetical protein [Pedobacter chinensis]RDC56741.1 hypothetical protein DU508_05940 [Pedobacter chinensis]